jgi:anthranilate synthase/aminodeoxychorismate synthase-like glutamine amidotransferase
MMEFLASHSSIPVLGICLGMQSMVTAEGGVVDRMVGPVHGRSTRITHTDPSVFEGLPTTFDAGRYHSLCATELPDSLEVIATDETGIPMALVHRDLPWVGLQFHPESVLTPAGPQILRNIIRRFP